MTETPAPRTAYMWLIDWLETIEEERPINQEAIDENRHWSGGLVTRMIQEWIDEDGHSQILPYAGNEVLALADQSFFEAISDAAGEGRPNYAKAMEAYNSAYAELGRIYDGWNYPGAWAEDEVK